MGLPYIKGRGTWKNDVILLYKCLALVVLNVETQNDFL